MKKELSFNEVYQQDEEKQMTRELSFSVLNSLIFETKKKEGNISKWMDKWLKTPKNKTAYESLSNITKPLVDNNIEPEKVKSATFNTDTQKWNYSDPRVVANELFEATRINERVITLAEREEIKAECPNSKKKDIDKLLTETVLKDDLKGISKGNDGKWVIDFDNKELQKELASNKKSKRESYTP